jgi:hypothetical protein
LLTQSLCFGVFRHVYLGQGLPRRIKMREKRLHHPVLCLCRLIARCLVRVFTIILAFLLRIPLNNSMRLVSKSIASTRHACFSTAPAASAA